MDTLSAIVNTNAYPHSTTRARQHIMGCCNTGCKHWLYYAIWIASGWLRGLNLTLCAGAYGFDSTSQPGAWSFQREITLRQHTPGRSGRPCKKCIPHTMLYECITMSLQDVKGERTDSMEGCVNRTMIWTALILTNRFYQYMRTLVRLLTEA